MPLLTGFQMLLKAHLEGSDEGGGFFSQINGDYLMANWYKIVLVVVLAACVIGLIIGNVRYFVKRIRNKKNKTK